MDYMTARNELHLVFAMRLSPTYSGRSFGQNRASG